MPLRLTRDFSDVGDTAAPVTLLDATELQNLKKDWQRRTAKLEGQSLRKKIHFVLTKPQYRTLIFYRLERAFRKSGGIGRIVGIIGRVFGWLRVRSSYTSGLEILTYSLGGGVILPHFGPIKLNATSVGEDLYLFHNVTVGNDYRTGVPTIGNNVFIGTHSLILGKINIGNNVVIAPGSRVVSDVPDNVLVAGNPAQVKKSIDRAFIAEMIGR